MTFPVERRIALAFAAAVAIIALVGAAALRSTAATVASAGWVAHTLEVRGTVAAALAGIADAEASARGYVITAADAPVGRFRRARTALAAVLDRLRALTADNAEQRRYADSLAALTGRRLARLEAVMDLRRQHGLAAAAREIASGEGPALTEEIRGLAARMQDSEDRLLAERSGALRRRAREARLAAWGGAALAVVLAVLGSVFAARELGARRAAAQALKESEHRLFQLLDALPVAVFVLDGAGRPYYANRRSQEILGRGIVPDAPPERLPEVYRAVVAGTDRPYPPERQPIAQALAGTAAHTADMEIRRPDGAVPIEVWAAPVFDTAGGVAFAIAAFQDISERRRAEAALRRYAAQLEAANAELDAFAYSVSHDLRAPLRAIDGFSQALLEDCGDRLDAAGRAHLARVRQATQRMAQLIDDLLNLSRVTRAQMRLAPVDLSALAQRIAAELRHSAPDRAVEFVIAPGLVVQGDPGLLHVALENLLANAWKFTAPRARARIEVGVTVHAGRPAYFVRDDGVGFDMRYADKLFGAFQRLHAAEEFPGTGIGLATVQRIVHRHGGRVWAEGAVDRGATFYFTL